SAGPAAAGHSAASPAAGGVDADALVGKLRTLVSSLVTEALAAQLPLHQQLPQQQQQQQGAYLEPTLPQQQPLRHCQQAHQWHQVPQQQQQPQQPQQQQKPQQQQPQRQHQGQKWETHSPGGHCQQPPQPQPQLLALQFPQAPDAASAGPVCNATSWGIIPGLQITIQQCPPQLSTTAATTTPAGSTMPMHADSPHSLSGSGTGASRGVAVCGVPSCRPSGPGNGSAEAVGPCLPGSQQPNAAVPDVMELNVDGTAVFVDRAALESQAAGSRLYDTLIKHYNRLPLDSQGRPYLSYEPRVFQVLLSHLKERWLFGSSSRAATCDWPRLVHSMGVSPAYFMQVACHFGMLDVVSSLLAAWPPPSSSTIAQGPRAARQAAQQPSLLSHPDTSTLEPTSMHQDQPPHQLKGTLPQPTLTGVHQSGRPAAGGTSDGGCVSEPAGSTNAAALAVSSQPLAASMLPAAAKAHVPAQLQQPTGCVSQPFVTPEVVDALPIAAAALARYVDPPTGDQVTHGVGVEAPVAGVLPQSDLFAAITAGATEGSPTMREAPVANGDASTEEGFSGGSILRPMFAAGVAAAAEAAQQQQAGTDAAVATGAAPYRMPSLYALMEQRQRAEEV
ncbi:hypothetical protein Agub_g15607, partial [Astrephomene gubernaculifera]